MASITAALRQVREDPSRLLDEESIHAACRAQGYDWRERVLDPVSTVRAMVVQVLHGNTAIADVVRLHHGVFSASAFCQARRRLPLEVLLRLFHRQNRFVQGVVAAGDGWWRAHRTWLIDSTGFSMPDTGVLQERFGQPANQAPGCGFPVSRTAVMFDWRSGLLLDFLPAPLDSGEPGAAACLRATLQPGDIMVGDSIYGTYAQLALCLVQGLHGVFEVHAQRAVSFARDRHEAEGVLIRRLGPEDQIVEWPKPPQRPRWMDQRQFDALPPTIRVRQTRRAVRDRGRRRSVTVVSTLLDHESYPADAIVRLHRCRWRIETNIRTLKHTLGLNVLRCTTVEGVLKELTVIALVYNMVRLVMLEASRRQGVAPDRVSFIDALRWWRYARNGEPLPRLLINPDRPERHEPRVKKRRHTAYPFMHATRRILRGRLRSPPQRAN